MTLGLSPCPNDTYIFHALLHHLVPSPAHFTPHMADVEELNALARQKKLPVTKLSLGVVPYIMDDYAIMASGAALGWGCGPLVVAREDLPEEKWKTARVAVPGLMTTANLLLTLHGGFQGAKRCSSAMSWMRCSPARRTWASSSMRAVSPMPTAAW